MTTSPAEVGGADLGIGTEGGGGVFEGDTASLEHIATVGDFEGKIGVLFNQENCDAALAVDLRDLGENRFHEKRGDAE